MSLSLGIICVIKRRPTFSLPLDYRNLTALEEKCQQPRNFFLFWQLKSNLVQLEYYKEMWGKRPGFLATLSESESCSVMSDSLRHHGLYSPWNSPGQNTGIGSCSLLQGIFPTQGLNPGLPHCRRVLYQLSYQGSPQRLWEIDHVQSLMKHKTCDKPKPFLETQTKVLSSSGLRAVIPGWFWSLVLCSCSDWDSSFLWNQY